MNCDIPYLPCWVRSSHISKQGGMEQGYAFAIQSVPGRALGFHVMLRSGAHYRNVPIHAIATRPISKERPLGDCQLWDCFSYKPEVTVFNYLRDHEAICYLRSGEVEGKYLFTVDWLPDSWERPGLHWSRIRTNVAMSWPWRTGTSPACQPTGSPGKMRILWGLNPIRRLGATRSRTVCTSLRTPAGM